MNGLLRPLSGWRRCAAFSRRDATAGALDQQSRAVEDEIEADLERTLEQHVAKTLDLRTTFFVRTAEDLDDVIAHNPFPDDAKTDPGHLVVEFLKDAPAAAGVKQLQAAIKGPETVRAHGKHVYIVYPAGIGRSKLTNKLIEDKLGTRGTGRNWNTVLKLAAMVHA